jgi:signal peptidase I
MSRERELKKRAQKDLDDLRFILRRARKQKNRDPETIASTEALGQSLLAALKSKNWDELEKLLPELEESIEKNFLLLRPNAAWESVKAFTLAVGIALVIRWFLIEPFRIPSGSMIPNLLIGDQLLVNKTVYGPDYYWPVIAPDPSDPGLAALKERGAIKWRMHVFGHDVYWIAEKMWLRREPLRGEVVVFRFPDNPREDYIKRVVGVSGDKVELKAGRLYINDQLQPEVEIGPYQGPMGEDGCREPILYEEDLIRPDAKVHHQLLHCRDTLYMGSSMNYGPIVVPPRHFFAMGDNRDRSYDSRAWGFVPVSHLKGRALFIHLPLDPERHYLPRWNRFFRWVN